MPSVTRPKRDPLVLSGLSRPGCAARPFPRAQRPATAVLLPGSGSDAAFVRAVFAGPLRSVGVGLIAPDPRPGPRVPADLLADLDVAAAAVLARGEALLVGGISLGAQLAARWASRGGRPDGLLLALPAWRGDPAGAPAARAARYSAARVRAAGPAGALAEVRASAPQWLADELGRAWTGYGPALADSLDAAAASPGPDVSDLQAIDVPAGVAAVRGDAVHPEAEAEGWRNMLCRSALVTIDLDAFGADPEVLGRAAVLAWLRAAAG